MSDYEREIWDNRQRALSVEKDKSASEGVDDDLKRSMTVRPQLSHLRCDEVLIGIALEISRQRRNTLLQLLSALENNDWPQAKALAESLCGNEKSNRIN